MPISGQGAAQAVASEARKVAVDLVKRYNNRCDMIYSAGMRRIPRIPQFKDDEL